MAIRLIILYTILLFVKEMTVGSILKDVFAPDKPPLRRVRTFAEPSDANDFVVFDFVGMSQWHSYPAEEHKVTTEDGYNILVHRITGSPFAKNPKEKRVVYLQHGFCGSSDIWLITKYNNTLPFVLADAGYDVWLGNFRGNSYARSHVNMSTSDQKFWEFGFYEKGLYDVSAITDYILNHTGQDKLIYIGHSLSAGVITILLSMRPEYNDKFSLVVSFAPAMFWQHGLPPILQVAKTFIPIIKDLLDRNGIYEVFPQSPVYELGIGVLCSGSTFLHQFGIQLCSTALTDPDGLTKEPLLSAFLHYPAGTSTQACLNYFQNFNSGEFEAFDYGPAGNYIHYNQKTPPTYDYRKITAPFAVFYSVDDKLVYPENALELARRVPNVRAVEEVPRRMFMHSDFLFAHDAKTLVYDRLMELFNDI